MINPRVVFLFALFASIFTPSLAEGSKKCRALVLQGGGDKGSYEAGVLHSFITYAENPEDFQYDVITGVSVGSINGMCFMQYEKGNEKSVISDLIEFWSAVTQSQIFKPWPGGIAQGLLMEPSLYNNDPERVYLEERVRGVPDKRKAVLVTTDVNTGQKFTFNETYWKQDIVKALDSVMYSTAVPFLFKYRNWGEKTFVDGGWSGEGIDIEDAILRCKEVVSDEKDIIVDVIFAGNFSNINARKEKYTTLQVYDRYMNIKKHIASTKTYATAQAFYPDVDFRYVVSASEKLPNQDVPLDFKKENLLKMIAIGKKDGLKALQEGPGKGAERLKRIGGHI